VNPQLRRHFLISMAGTTGALAIGSFPASSDDNPIGRKLFPKHRRRRVIYNDDSDEQYFSWQDYIGTKITDEKSFVDARASGTFNSAVDTFVWCVGNGSNPPWAGRPKVYDFLGSSDGATDVIIKALHARGIEVWGSLRMNDIHDSFMAANLAETTDKLKAEHPEYLITPQDQRPPDKEIMERALWTSFNYARSEVRQHRLDFISNNASLHDFDGYELDFTRMPAFFRPGEGRASAHLMTQLVRDVRGSLNSIANRRGRPYTLAVHALDSPDLSLDLGLDVKTWLEEDLVDVLVVGLGYLPYALHLYEWLALGKRYSVQVYPSVNTNTYISWKQRIGHAVFREAIRAHSAYYLQEGADGLYLFNFFPQGQVVPKDGLSHEVVRSVLTEIGDPKLLNGKDKLYGIQPASDGNFFVYRSEASPLPIALDNAEQVLTLAIGPDATDPEANARIRIWTTGGVTDMRVWARLNFKFLGEVSRVGDWYEVDVPQGILRAGNNRLALWSDKPLSGTENPLIVHNVFVPVTYSAR